MKGLLLKDFYMMVKYCKMYILMVVLMFALSLSDVNNISDNNLFFLFYPCIIVGMIPVTLLSYDERSKWNAYSGTLPCNRAQIVSAKYLLGMFILGLLLVLSGIVQAVKMGMNGTFALDNYLILMEMLLIVSCVVTSVMLPFMFGLGTEKGRIVYFVMIIAMCAGCFAAVDYVNPFNLHFQTAKFLPMEVILLLVCIAAIGLYALSWYLSIVFYKKREEG